MLSKLSLVKRIRFGFESKKAVLAAFDSLEEPFEIRCGIAELQDRLNEYANSKEVSFKGFELDTSWMAPFHKKVLLNCFNIPYGSTVSYKELAALSGTPNAARAVGTAMKINRLPIVIPCHRVVSSSGLGGYSASTGVDAKQRLIRMEQQVIGISEPQKLLFE